MRKIIAVCLGLVMVLGVEVYGAKLSWETGADLPEAVAFAPACEYNGKVYVAGGLKSVSFDVEIKDCWWEGKGTPEMPTTDFYALKFVGYKALPQKKDITENWQFHIDPDDLGMTTTPYWFSVELDTTGWETINAGEKWEQYPELLPGCTDYDGVAWYRKLVPSFGWGDGEIWVRLYKVDDEFTLWVNGQKVGEFEETHDKLTQKEITDKWNWDQDNLIAVRVNDEKDDGGIKGRVELINEEKSFYGDASDYQYTSLLDYDIGLGMGTAADLMEEFLGIPLGKALTGMDTHYYTYQIGASATVGISDKVYMGDIDEDGKVTNWTALNSLPSSSLYGCMAAGKAANGKDYLYSIGGSMTGGSASFNLLDFAVGTAVTEAGLEDDPPNRDIVWLGADFAAFSIPGAADSTGFEAENFNKVYRAPIESDGTIGAWVEDMPLLSETTTFYGANYKAYIRDNKLCLIGGFGMLADIDFSDLMAALPKIFPYLSAGLYADIKTDGSLNVWERKDSVLGSKFPIFPLLLATIAWNDENFYVIGGLSLADLINELLTGTTEEMDIRAIMEMIEADFEVPETYRLPFGDGFPLTADTTSEATTMLVANYPEGSPILASCAATNERICLAGGAWAPAGLPEIDPEDLPRINLEKDLWTQEIFPGFATIGELVPLIVGGAFQKDTQIGNLTADGDILQMWNTVDECPEGLPAGALGAPMVTDGENFIIIGGLSGMSLSPSGPVRDSGVSEFCRAGDKLTGSLKINKTALTLAPAPEIKQEYGDIEVFGKVFKTGDKENPIQIRFKNEPAKALADPTKRAEIKDKVKLFDLAGVEVPVVADTDYKVESDGVKFYGTSEGKDLPTGIYIYQIEIEGKFYTGTAIPIK